MKKLFKIMTLVSILTFQSQAFSRELKREVVFEQLKNDLWTMGLNFDYADGTRFVIPADTDDSGHEPLPEEISKVLEI
ncbi:hypothetical protein [Bacteriovorax sp. Seq25_V]|uniref:hypothetical protein n=1 Tax=Bacteriovorax sp. Seq25_V TaxID=1201288 RepID=UPI00038A3C3A|nr:hypothetical protein [Bacteriovorax sp. Seq25_V]EQC45624.1 hypothetical protein M900_2305 [Bacteriovorax sp. Seq25_V]